MLSDRLSSDVGLSLPEVVALSTSGVEVDLHPGRHHTAAAAAAVEHNNQQHQRRKSAFEEQEDDDEDEEGQQEADTMMKNVPIDGDHAHGHRMKKHLSGEDGSGSLVTVGGVGGVGGGGDVLADKYSLEPDGEDDPEIVYQHCGSSLLPGPPCVRNILGNELCERFSYYGLRSILVLYFHEHIGWSKEDAISVFSYSAALAYFTPILGGYLSDAKLGKYRTIISFSLLYVVGLILLSCSAIDGIAWLSIVGLVFIGLGTGGIKPCVSSFGADQFTQRHISSHEELKKREQQISSFFLFFYFCINLGSVGSFIITPLVKKYLGYAIAFGIPAVLLMIAVLVFWSARQEYFRGPIAGSVLTQMVRVFKIALKRRSEMRREMKLRRRNQQTMMEESPETMTTTTTTTVVDVDGPPAQPTNLGAPASVTAPHNWLDYALGSPSVTSSEVENAKSFWRVLPIFAVFPVFWMLFDQQSSSWTLQADEMDLHGLQPEQVGVLNPVFIMVLLPLFDKFIYPAIGRCLNFTPLRRMGVGMLVSVVAFLLSAGVESWITSASRPKSISVFWQMPQIFLISIAEILVSVTGLEFAYTQSTPQLKSTITAIFLIMTAIGNLLTGVLYTALAKVMSATAMYVLFAGLMVVNFFVFLIVASRYRPVVILDEKVRGIEEENETEEEKKLRSQRKMTNDGDGNGQPTTRDDGDNSIVDESAIEMMTTRHHGQQQHPHHPHPAHLKRASTTSFFATSDINAQREEEEEEEDQRNEV